MSSRVTARQELVNAENATTERFSHIYIANGKLKEGKSELLAEDLGVTVGLKNTHNNNSLNIKGLNRKVESIPFPTPRHHAAVVALNN